MIMSVSKIFLPLLALLLTSCAMQNVSKVKIPQHSCKPCEIKTQFEPVKDLSSSLRNQELASLYFYQQKEQMHNTVECYEKLLNEVNK